MIVRGSTTPGAGLLKCVVTLPTPVQTGNSKSCSADGLAFVCNMSFDAACGLIPLPAKFCRSIIEL